VKGRRWPSGSVDAERGAEAGGMTKGEQGLTAERRTRTSVEEPLTKGEQRLRDRMREERKGERTYAPKGTPPLVCTSACLRDDLTDRRSN
jgi:hypothetical protein